MFSFNVNNFFLIVGLALKNSFAALECHLLNRFALTGLAASVPVFHSSYATPGFHADFHMAGQCEIDYYIAVA